MEKSLQCGRGFECNFDFDTGDFEKCDIVFVVLLWFV
jgi:hypothetical protein